MKKLSLVVFLSVFGLGILSTTTSCRKKPVDPCEGVRCDEGYKCVEGKCVEIRRK